MVINSLRIGALAPHPFELRTEDEVIRTWDYSSKPIVSIICLAFNHEKYIEDALRGFLGQITKYSFEILVRDDHSSDGTQNILMEYLKKYPNIIKLILEDENFYSQGCDVISRVLSHARGEFIALCEGDDYWLDSRKLEKQANFLTAHKDYSLCYHDSIVVSESGKIDSLSKLPLSCRIDFPEKELKQGAHILTQTVFFRNYSSELPFEFKKVINGDTFLFAILGRYGKGHFMDEVEPSVYRVHSGGIHSSKANRERLIYTINTFLWMSIYFSKIPGEGEISKSLMLNASDLIISLGGVRFRSRLKLIFPRIYGVLKKFKSLAR